MPCDILRELVFSLANEYPFYLNCCRQKRNHRVFGIIKVFQRHRGYWNHCGPVCSKHKNISKHFSIGRITLWRYAWCIKFIHFVVVFFLSPRRLFFVICNRFNYFRINIVVFGGHKINIKTHTIQRYRIGT